MPENKILDWEQQKGSRTHRLTRAHRQPPLPRVGSKVTASKAGTLQGCLGNYHRLLDLGEVGALKGPPKK